MNDQQTDVVPMTVRDLKALLADLPDDLLVVSTDCQLGGYWYAAKPVVVNFKETLGESKHGAPAVLIEIQ